MEQFAEQSRFPRGERPEREARPAETDEPAAFERQRADEKRRILDFELSGDPGADAKAFLEVSGHNYHRMLIELQGMSPEAALGDLRDAVSRAVAHETERKPLDPRDADYRYKQFIKYELPKAHVTTINKILAERRSASPGRVGESRAVEARRREGAAPHEALEEVREEWAKARRAAAAAREFEVAIDAVNPERTPFRIMLENMRKRLEEHVVMNEIAVEFGSRRGD